jgi:hypothetical protein
VKLNTGAAPPAFPPKEGVTELPWFAFPPNREPPEGGAVVAGEGPPNWNDEPPVDGVVEPPKLNMPPVAGAAGAAGLSPPLPPAAKGLLPVGADAPPPPKLKLNPPAPALDEAPPKLGAPEDAGGVAVEDAPNRLVVGWLWPPPKLKMGAAEPEPLAPVNDFLAGEGSSCFMGLPLNMEFWPAPVGGDLGAPNRGFADSCGASFGWAAPKLKAGAEVD